MTIKITHISDVHVGAKLGWLGAHASDHRKRIIHTFEKILTNAQKHHTDAVVISGDLFDTPFPSPTNLAYVQNLITHAADSGIYLAILPGNHDRLANGSVYLTNFANHPKILLFNNGKAEKFDIDALDLSIYGFGIFDQFSSNSPLSPLVELFNNEKNKRYNIALVHGSVNLQNRADNNFPIDPNEIKSSHFDYIALGDWHGLLEIAPNAWYSGSPEVLAFDQEKSGNYIEVEINEDKTNVKPIKISNTEFENIDIDMSEILVDENNKSYERILLDKISNLGSKNKIQTVNIVGRRPITVDLKFDEISEICASKFFYLKINDHTQIEIDDPLLMQFPDELIVGRFISSVRKKLESTNDPIETKFLKDVLQEGVRRLIQNI